MEINLKLSLREMIKKDKDKYAHLSDIEWCFLYHGEPKLFRELDSSKEAVAIYDKTDQLHGTEHYDTMTSWVQFAKEFLGFGYNAPFSEIYKKYKEHDNKEKWVIERIKASWNVGDEEAQNALELFSKFSKYIYSVGNIVPVGYNPGKTRRNDRWEIKLPWIHNTYFDNSASDGYKNRGNAWVKFLGKLRWDQYLERYFLEDQSCPQEYPENLQSWETFMGNTVKYIEKREKKICEYCKNAN